MFENVSCRRIHSTQFIDPFSSPVSNTGQRVPFLCKFCGLFLSFCFTYPPSMAAQLPSRGSVNVSVLCLSLVVEFLGPFSSEDQAQAPPLSGLLDPTGSQTKGLWTLSCLESRFRGISVGHSGYRFFFGISSLTFKALLSFAVFLCLSCPGCRHSAPIFPVPPCPSEVPSLLVSVPVRTTLHVSPVAGFLDISGCFLFRLGVS